MTTLEPPRAVLVGPDTWAGFTALMRIAGLELHEIPASPGRIPRYSVEPLPRVARDMATLSVREHEVLSLVAEGLTTVQIGARIHLSAHTIKSHLKAAFRKLGARDRAQAVAVAYRLGVLGGGG